MGLSDWLQNFQNLSGTRYELPPEKEGPEQPDEAELQEQKAFMLPTGEREVWSNEVLYHRLTPEKLKSIVDSVLTGEDCVEYLQLAEELEVILEPHYRTVISQRKDAVCALPVRVLASSDERLDEQLAQEVRELLVGHDDWSDCLRDLLDGLGKGFAVAEMIWELRKTAYGLRWVPHCLQRVEPRWFRYYGGDGRTLGLRQSGTLELEPLQSRKWIIHEPHLLSAPPIKSGLALPVLFLGMLKRFNMNQWARYVERYGKPTRIGTYPKWATEKGKKTLARAVASVGLSMGVTIPEGMEINVLEDKGGSRSAQYSSLADFVNKEISKIVLQQTMTTESGSSRSQSETHNEVRHTMRDADACALARSVRYYLFRSYVELNYPAGTRVPGLGIAEPKAEDLGKLVENVGAMIPFGLRVGEAELRERLGLREPQQGEDVLEAESPSPNPSPKGEGPSRSPSRGPQANWTNCRISANAEGDSGNGETDVVDGLLDAIPDDEWELLTDELLDGILKSAKGAANFEEFTESLAGSVENSALQKLIESLALAQFQAFADGAAEEENEA